MNRRALVVALVVCGLAPALLDRVALRTATDDPHHEGFLDRSLATNRRSVLPGLRALFVQLWIIRIHAAVDRADQVSALRFAREALAIGPDLPIARARIASVVAFEVAASARSKEDGARFIGEALRILDEGLARDPANSDLEFERGVILWLRGQYQPAFERAFREKEGRSTLEAGADSLVRAARGAQFDFKKLVFASSALEVRAKTWKDRAKEHDAALTSKDPAEIEILAKCLRSAREDYEELSLILRAQVALMPEADSTMSEAIAYADANVELLRLNEQKWIDGQAVDKGRIEELLKIVRAHESS